MTSERDRDGVGLQDAPAISAADLRALADEADREQEEQRLAARNGTYIAATSEADLIRRLVEIEFRLMSEKDNLELDELLAMHDQAQLMADYMKSLGRSLIVQKQSEVVRLRTERLAGTLLASLGRGRWHPVAGPGIAPDQPVLSTSAYRDTLEAVNLNERRAQRLQEVAGIPAETFEAYLPGAATMSELAMRAAERDQEALAELERADYSRAGLLRFVRRSEQDSSAQATRWDECPTPREVVERAELLLGAISLDPAAEAEMSIAAERHFTADDNGLVQEWRARKILLHPPYSRTREFLEKLMSERAARPHATEAVVVLSAPLIERRWDAVWWGEIAHLPFCVLSARLAGPRLPYPLTMVSYVGQRTADFVSTFSSLGPVLSGA